VYVELTPSQPVILVDFKLWNEGDTPTNLSIVLNSDIKQFTDYQENSYYIPANTQRMSGFKTFTMRFIKMSYGARSVETSFILKADKFLNGTVGIVPQVSVKVRINQSEGQTPSAITLQQIEQAYSFLLNTSKPKLNTTFNWWSSLWGETIIKAEHPNESNTTNQTENTKDKPAEGLPQWLIFVIFVACILIGGFGAYYIMENIL
jgi:hypothetical protein